jgi:hypothetical protein
VNRAAGAALVGLESPTYVGPTRGLGATYVLPTSETGESLLVRWGAGGLAGDLIPALRYPLHSMLAKSPFSLRRRSGSTFRTLLCVIGLLVAAAAQAQTVTVYSDSLQNGFQDYSYGGGSNFASTVQVHSGSNSISFLGNNFNAVSFDQPAGPYSTATYPTLRLWVRGGAANQHLQLVLQNGANNVVAQASLDNYIPGGVIANGQWLQATVNFTQAPLNYNGNFDRIDLQWNSGAAAPAGQEIYLDDIELGQTSVAPSGTLIIDHDITLGGGDNIPSDRFTWQDSANHPRVAVLAHNDGVTFNGAQGGSLRQFQYQLANGSTRTATVTTYGNAGYEGFGYVVSHSTAGNCVGDDSPLGGFIPGTWTRIFEGRHHAIFRFQQNYPRNCTTDNSGTHTIPVTIDWVFSTGRDNPLWAITYNIAGASPALAANIIFDDSRAPYGELNIDGEGFQDIDGTAWGDRFKFTSTTAPVTLSSDWTWNVANTVPYIKEWIGTPLGASPVYNRDATMGLVQTQPMSQQDAAGGRGTNFGPDMAFYWGKTSAQGNAGGAYKMPIQNEWPYQANADSIGVGAGSSNNNSRLTWGTQWGFLGQTSYQTNDPYGNTSNTAPGYPKKSYSVYVVLGQHTAAPVETQVTQIETIQSLTFTPAPTIGSVVTTCPAGINRSPDTVTCAPAGYNHVYGALAFSAAGNALDATINVGSGTIKNPMIIISNYTSASYPTVKLGGVTLTSDAGYYASLRGSANELWITLNANLSGAGNHFEILAPAGGGAPAVPTGVVATASTTTQVDITWPAVPGATSYEVERVEAGNVITQVGTPPANSFSDTTAAPSTAYLYRVRAKNASGTSANSAPDLATTVIFVDPSPLAGVNIKAFHLFQLRTAVNAVRTLAGDGTLPFTDAATAGTPIRALHVTELRTAVDHARGILLLSTGGYTDSPTLTGIIKAVHWQELRLRVQ